MDHEDMKEHFLAVYERFADDIFRFCVLKVSARAVAEDLTQEVFMRFWQQLRSGSIIEHDRALLYKMARNLIIDWYRKHKTQSLDALTEEGFEFASEDHDSIVTHAQVREVLAVIHPKT
jgi:RNA polymerase sigma-70 factor (ECF subfamily)